MSKMEKMLQALLDGDTTNTVPQSRVEAYLKNCIEGCGCDGLPVPQSRLEVLLYALAEKMAGGGSGGGGVNIDAILDKSVTEVSSAATGVISDKMFYQCNALVSANFPNVTSIGASAFYICGALKSANFPKATDVGNFAFIRCVNLENIDFSSATQIGDSAFQNCSKFTSVCFPSVTKLIKYAFCDCQGLITVDLPKATSIDNYTFNGCVTLKAVILRSETLCTLGGAKAFDACYRILGKWNGTYNPNTYNDGYIYVPRALVDSYKAATNWSTHASKIRVLEDYTVDGTITGALDPTKI